jgi:hypothetical protein
VSYGVRHIKFWVLHRALDPEYADQTSKDEKNRLPGKCKLLSRAVYFNFAVVQGQKVVDMTNPGSEPGKPVILL